MLKELFTAAMGMMPQQTRMEVIANNMANAGTAGYKRENVFERNLIDARGNFYNTPGDVEQNDPPVGTYLDFSKGAFQKTDNPLDLAIDSDNSFFVVQDDDGNQYYTRGGQFKMDEQGNIITQDNKKLMGEGGEINLKKQYLMDKNDTSDSKAVKIKITENGEVFANQNQVGTIQVAKVENPQTLQHISASCFTATKDTEATFVPPEEAHVQQGWTENSNVDIIKEMVGMIELQRAFETGSKVISTNNETLDKSIAIGRFY